MDVSQKFVQAWLACENPPLDSVNPHYRSRFASLGATLGVIRAACSPHGLCYRQSLSFDGANGVLSSCVMDGEGAVELSDFPVFCSSDPQEFGKALTYAKRQQAQADWGITGEEDTDGEPTPPRTPKPDRRQAMLRRCEELSRQCVDSGMNEGATDEYMRAAFGVGSPEQLSDDQLAEFGKYLAAMARQMKGEA